MHIAYITDENHAMLTSVSLTSLKKNRNPDTIYKIHIIVSDISVSAKNRLLSLNDINFEIDIRNVSSDERFSSYTSHEAYDKAVVIHLCSHEKPWIYEKGCLSRLYNKYYELSPYAGNPMPGIILRGRHCKLICI